MIIGDTSAWYAANIVNDENHDEAASFLRRVSEPLVTSDYVVDILLKLLRVRGHCRKSISVGTRIVVHNVCKLEWVGEADLVRAWEIFSTYDDKLWSLTNCVTFAVMERLRFTKTFAFDDHFRQFGAITVLP